MTGPSYETPLPLACVAVLVPTQITRVERGVIACVSMQSMLGNALSSLAERQQKSLGVMVYRMQVRWS